MVTESEIKIKVTIYKQTQWASEDWPPDNALLCIAWFNEKINQIPQEYRNSAQICIEGISSYDNESVSEIEIFYLRNLTNEEIMKHLLAKKADKNAIKAHELKELERLKRKYEN